MRLKRYLQYFLAAAILLLSGLEATASRTVVRAKMDSLIMMMGKMSYIDVMVEQGKNDRGRFPLFSQIRENGIIPLCGDSVELRAPVKVDTTLSGDIMQIQYKIPVQSFDSGFYRLPAFEFVVGVDTARSEQIAFKVVPVNVEANSPIDDYANVSDPENGSIFDSVPNWVLDYWWVIVILILLAVTALWAYRKYRKDGTLLAKKPEPTPYEVAIRDLKELKEKKLWEQGLEKEYYTDLTDILRTYLYKRFGINAIEMTSRQILSSLGNNAETKDKRQYFRQILNMADFVKFAKVRPLPADNVASFENAWKFVEETKPVPVPEDETANDAPKDKKATKKKGGKK